MEIFGLKDLIKEIKQDNRYYKSFVDNEKMDAGVLYLEPDRNDTQHPHTKDEIYFILKGDGYLTVNGEKHQIEENKFYLVPKNTEHRFSDNSIEIIAIYFFGA